LPATELLAEAGRQLTICNACRYCEGFCAVWPAMERRRTFTSGDLVHLANLCFDCRACFYACQYAPPHEFAMNVPRVMAEIRTETYAEFSWPTLLARFFRGSGGRLAAALAAGVAIVVTLTFGLGDRAAASSPQSGDGAFFRVIPYALMTLPFLVIAGYGVGVFVAGARRFWRDTDSQPRDLLSLAALGRATRDALVVRYLDGGGAGCPYPEQVESFSRRTLHHLVAYGFVLDLASTTTAAVYQHLLGWEAPYPLLSLPVVLGSAGGVLLMLGSGGLLWLKWRSDRRAASEPMVEVDTAFAVTLFLLGASGMVLLALRDTAAMGLLLAIHLGLVGAFFVTLPYSKFAHVVYRYASLVRNSLEEAREARVDVGRGTGIR
jgi:citrate/tricarballylate utilization protein